MIVAHKKYQYTVIIVLLAGATAENCSGEPSKIWNVLHESAVNEVVIDVDSDEFDSDWDIVFRGPYTVPSERLFSLELYYQTCERPHAILFGTIDYNYHQIYLTDGMYASMLECPPAVEGADTIWTNCDNALDGTGSVRLRDNEFRLEFSDYKIQCDAPTIEGNPQIRSIILNGAYTAPMD
jgi:hypothetical protein